MHALAPRNRPGPRSTALLLTLATLALAPVGTAAQSLTGSWTLTTETPRGEREMTLVLEQDGKTLTGTAETRRGEAPVEGTVDGAEVVFVVRMTPPRGDRVVEIRYTGKLDGDVIEGTMTPPARRGPRGEGPAPDVPFSAVRKG